MTQEALAKTCGISVRAVQLCEAGERMPKIEKSLDLCVALGCTLTQLFDSM